MLSALTVEGAGATLQALELGAIDFMAKPAGPVSLEIEELRPILVEKIRTAAAAKLRRSLRLRDRVRHRIGQASAEAVRPRPQPRATPEPRPSATEAPAEIPGPRPVGLLTSTGGPPWRSRPSCRACLRRFPGRY